jgi:hypothetical protein
MPRFAPAVALALVAATAAARASPRLSPVLRAGGDVRAASLGGPLPGIAAPSYAGFFEVNATAHAEHFFWYWPALNGNASAPLLVWLQGGPGSSSLFGMWAEHGPYRRAFKRAQRCARLLRRNCDPNDPYTQPYARPTILTNSQRVARARAQPRVVGQ